MDEPNSMIFLGNIAPNSSGNGNESGKEFVRSRNIEEMQRKVDVKFYFYLLKYIRRQEMAARAAKRIS